MCRPALHCLFLRPGASFCRRTWWVRSGGGRGDVGERHSIVHRRKSFTQLARPGDAWYQPENLATATIRAELSVRLNVYTGDDGEDRCADGKANAFALAEFDLGGVGVGVGLRPCGGAGAGAIAVGGCGEDFGV